MSVIYNSVTSPFYAAYKMYKNYIGYSKPISYTRWLRLPDKYKAAYLYVQFYNEITLAWYKVKTQWSIEEEGVECINQYLIKNVEKIKLDKKRFTPQYIYKVAYNCLYCVCIDPSKNKDKFYHEVSETFDAGEDECSWFDFIGQDYDIDELNDLEELRDWVDSLDEISQLYIAYIFGEMTDSQICRQLKKLGLVSGSTVGKDKQHEILESFCKDTKLKIKAEFEISLQ